MEIECKCIDNSQIKVSVVIITYNHFSYIRQCIDSVLCQAGDFDWELIIADDCSTDGTIEIIKEYAANYPQKVKLLLQETNVGTTKNIKSGFLLCQGKYITAFAGDDYWTDANKLSCMYQWLEEHPDYLGVSHVLESKNNEGISFGLHPETCLRGQDASVKLFLKGIHFSTATTFFLNIFKSIYASSYLNLITTSRLIEDLSLSLILLNCGKIHVLDKNMSVHRIGGVGDHNYNYLKNPLQVMTEHFEVYKANEDFFSNRYDLTQLYLIRIWPALSWCMKHNALSPFLKSFQGLSLKVRVYTVMYLPVKVFRTISFKIVNSKDIQSQKLNTIN